MKYFILVYKFWDTHLESIIVLINEAAKALQEEFKVYFPDLIPNLLKVIEKDTTENRRFSIPVLKTLVILGSSLDGYLYLIIPGLVDLMQLSSEPINVRIEAVKTLGKLIQVLKIEKYTSRILHPLARILEKVGPNDPLVPHVMDTLCSFVYQLGPQYLVFSSYYCKCS